MKKKKTKKADAQGRRCSGAVEASLQKKTLTAIFFPGARLMLRGKARKTGAFPEHANCNGVVVMSQRTGGKGWLYRHTSGPGLTPTRHRSVGRQGALSHRLVVMA